MKKTSLTRALLVAGVMAAGAGLAQADAIFYPDGTHVELGPNAVENGLADSVLASSGDFSVDTSTLGAGPSGASRMTTTTVTTTSPVYVFPNINFDRHTVLSSAHPMMSHVRSMEIDRTAAASFDSPSRAGEASTMTSGAPNLVTDNETVATVPPGVVDTTSLGAGPAHMGSTWYGPSTTTIELRPSQCAPGMTNCGYIPG